MRQNAVTNRALAHVISRRQCCAPICLRGKVLKTAWKPTKRYSGLISAAASGLEELVVDPISVIEGHVKLPGSKSLSNRVLLLAALAEGTTVVENILVRK